MSCHQDEHMKSYVKNGTLAYKFINFRRFLAILFHSVIGVSEILFVYKLFTQLFNLYVRHLVQGTLVRIMHLMDVNPSDDSNEPWRKLGR